MRNKQNKLKSMVIPMLLLTFTFSTMFAQTPEKMSYQAVIRNSSNTLVTNTQVGMRISILQSSIFGSSIYVETQSSTTNPNGLVSIEIGSGTVVIGDFSTIDWANDSYFIKTETDPSGGTNYSITGTSQLLSVPYALHAKTAESIMGAITETDPIFTEWDKDYNDLTNTPTIPTVPENVSAFTNDAGYLTGYTETQTISDVAALNNSVNTQLKNVTDPTEAQDAATKMYVDALEQQIEKMQNSLINAGLLVKDYDGNVYGTVTIGTQVWMKEDLKTTHYPNGDDIPLVIDNTEWGNLQDKYTDDAYCYYNNNTSGEATTYGALYTYAAAIGDNWVRDNTDNQGVCPDGWHLPTVVEWDALNTYLGSDAGSKLAGNAALWTDGALDQNANFGISGFTAFPSGYRDSSDGMFDSLGDFVYWWAVSELSSYAHYRYLDYSSTTISSLYSNHAYGFSVRCIRD